MDRIWTPLRASDGGTPDALLLRRPLNMKRVWLCSLLALAIVTYCYYADALQVDELDPHREWQTKAVVIEGNAQVPTSQLQAEMVTTTRPWYTPWRSRPRFDPVAFKTDIERLQRLYRAQGYYEAQVSYDLEVEPGSELVTARITMREGAPVRVSRMLLEVSDQPALTPIVEALRPELPLTEGGVFVEDRYQAAEAKIKEKLLDLHYGRAQVTRHATVILEDHVAEVWYTAEAGPQTVFGETTVEGTTLVEPAIVLRELTYRAGEPFSAAAIDESRKNILKLDLFSAVRFLEDSAPNAPNIIPMRINVSEKPFREWQAGIGFGTEDEVRGQVRWRHNNWFGDGRKLDIQVRASSLSRNIDVSFLQPHAFGRHNRFLLSVRPQQLDEPGYLLNSTRLQPRFERDFTRQLTGFIAYRLEYDRLNNVASATASALTEFRRKGVLSGVSAGLSWNTTDDPLNATHGGLVSLSAEQVGGVLGSDFEFVKIQGEMRRYHLILPRLVLAGRLKVGFADPSGHSKEIPLFERFYAGGISSVRGYGRHRLGPISASDDPIGGRSLLEGSLELRRQLTEKIGGTLFLDFGQVSLHSFDVPLDDIQFSTGFGVLYTTPVGPVLLALGFPFNPPHSDQAWQVHFNIGQFF